MDSTDLMRGIRAVTITNPCSIWTNPLDTSQEGTSDIALSFCLSVCLSDWGPFHTRLHWHYQEAFGLFAHRDYETNDGSGEVRARLRAVIMPLARIAAGNRFSTESCSLATWDSRRGLSHPWLQGEVNIGTMSTSVNQKQIFRASAFINSSSRERRILA